MQKKISIITVCYNAATSLEKTIRSVIDQTYSNIEYIIVDGGSTDGTIEIIKHYANKISFWYSEPDDGIYDAMNKAFEYSTGEYAFFLNAGDIFFNNFVLEQISKELNGIDIVYGDVMMHSVDNHCKRYDGKFNKFKLTYHNICHQSIFYPKEFYKNYKFDLRYKLLADWVSNIQLWRKKKYRYVPYIVSHYYRGGLSDTQEDQLFNTNYISIIKNNLGVIAWAYVYYRRYKIKFFRGLNHIFSFIVR